MSKKTHERELERARAKRQQDAYAQRQQKIRYAAIALIVVMAGGVFVAAAASRDSGDDAALGFDETTDGFDDTTTSDPVTEPGTLADPQEPVVAADACQNPSQGAPESPRKTYAGAPDMVIDTAKTYVATIDTTCGTVVVELDAAMSPTTVNNFVFLARDGYYDGAPFHRVIDGFMIQGGDPSGTGHGEGGTFPGYTFADELALAEQITSETGGYPRGVIAMANSGADTNGSQFFIMQADYALPPNYAIFGKTLSGLDVVDRIVVGPAAGDQAIDPVRIIAITIEER